jgi:5-methylthioadenosine/S-adenosylhomocysteine deaminase
MPESHTDTPDSTSEQDSFRVDARWLITMNEHDDVLNEHSLIVQQGRIISILPWAEAERDYSALPTYDQREAILMPGLINTHTHLAMNLLRGFADDKPLQTWLENHIWPAESQHMSAEFVRDGTELALAESLLAGVTTVNDMYFFADATAAICDTAGVRAMLGLLVIDFPSAWASNTDEYFHKALDLHDQYRQHARITTAFAPHAPYSVSTPSLERVATLSDELDLPVHIHVQETAGEIEQYEQLHGVRPIKALFDIGLLKPQLLAVHLTHLSNEDIEQLAVTGTHAIHVAVGTDGAASNNDLDLLGECRTAAFLAKATSGDASLLPAARALRMITIDAAKALGIDKLTGSLEIGKAADCITIAPDLRMLPVYDAPSAVLFANGAMNVQNVWVDGQLLVKHRELQTLDAYALQAKAERWGQRIAASR